MKIRSFRMESAKKCKWLIFPLEIVERELYAKLMICSEALGRGFGCIIGTDEEIFKSIDTIPSGAIFIKSCQAHELSRIRRFKDKGYKVICLDEEGLVQHNLNHMVSVRSTSETLNELDAFLFWGKTQCSAYKETYPEYREKYHIASHPRIDLWEKKKYQATCHQKVMNIKKQYGEYFIIPTSFGAYNHFMGEDGALNVYKAGNLVSQNYYTFLEGYREYAKNIYHGFIDLIEPLSKKFPDTNIIIRPHPSENRGPWDELAKAYDNVHVVFSGGITPWLLGAKAVLHCGSTTAVEAHLLGRPVISYCRGYNNPKYALEVPAKVSINVTDSNDVLYILQKITDGVDINSQYPEVTEAREWLKDWADGIGSYESSQKIMDIIDALAVQNVTYNLSKIPVRIKFDIQTLKPFVWSLLSILQYIPVVKENLPFRIKYGLRVQRYRKSKTNDIDPTDVKEFLAKLATINNRNDAQINVLKKNIITINAK